MNNSITNIKELIDKDIKILVPHYHRPYSMEIDFCNNFLNKILNSTNNNIGVITTQKANNDGSIILIDGYQRLVTVNLLLNVFKYHYHDSNLSCINFSKNNNDKIPYYQIKRNQTENLNINSSQISSIYNFLDKKIKENSCYGSDFITNLLETKVIIAQLDANLKDSENIYYNLNLNFSQVDLTRNFIYEILKKSQNLHIFNTYWLNIESLLNINMSNFLTDYVTIQNNGLIPKQNSLFSSFKEAFIKMSRFKTNQEVIKHIYRYASYYSRILTSNIKDNDIKSRLNTINNYKATDTYPYLMEVFEDYEFAHINKCMLIEILETLISFIQNKNNNQNNMDFASLSKNLNKILLLKELTPKIITKEIDDESPQKFTINQLSKNI